MTSPAITLTADLLSRLGACEGQVAIVRGLYPDRVDVSRRGIARLVRAGVTGWDWARVLLAPEAERARDAAAAEARRAYDAALAKARRVYDAATAEPWRACDAATAEARRVYGAATAEPWRVYSAVTAEAWRVYVAAMAEAWRVAWDRGRGASAAVQAEAVAS